MDFSGFLMIPSAAVITAIWIVGAALMSKRGHGFRAPFLLSYGLGIIFMEPWTIGSWEHVGMFLVMLVMLALWGAIGCLIGGLLAALIVSVGSKLQNCFK